MGFVTSADITHAQKGKNTINESGQDGQKVKYGLLKKGKERKEKKNRANCHKATSVKFRKFQLTIW